MRQKESLLLPNVEEAHESTSNIIFNLAQMGIPIKDAFFIEIDNILNF